MERFLNQIICGDCLEVMRDMPDNSIDAVVTDPPYELGFMGKKWDSTGIAYNVELWQEVLRVLKPGGHLLSFGGTRTYHRMTCAIEDAGFEIRDQMQWIYGCLSEDTEILTINGWEHYHKAIELHPVLCYNMDKDTFEFCKPERSFIYENKHTAYRIQSDYTDQIVSRNHRCIIERGGRKVFAYAETLEQQESVPVLESLHDLPESIPNIYEGTSIKKQDLLKRVRQQECRQEEHRENPARAVRRQNACNVCSVWETGMETQSMVKKGGNAYLQSSMQRSIKRAGMEAACAQRQTKLDGRIREVSQRKNDRAEQSCMEGRRNLLQNTWELCWSKICSLPGRIYGNVKKRRLCNGTPFNSCANTRKMLKEVGGGTPYRPQSSQQRTEQFNAFCEQSTAQKVRSNRKTRTTLATITPIEYHGNVWCVQVPTGAFVARRNGHIFITGNSGFPKSMDISKAIDKKFGAEREVVGSYTTRDLSRKDGKHKGDMLVGCYDGSTEFNITAPSTPEAKQYSGFGTALKPANEPIVVARKPLSEKTVAENVLKWGTGGINIDGCRVESNNMPKGCNGTGFASIMKTNVEQGYRPLDYYEEQDGFKYTPSERGRFPANVILDEEAGKMLDEQSGILKSGTNCTRTKAGSFLEHGGLGKAGDLQVTYGDSGGASRFFYCAKASKAERAGSKHPTVKPLKLIRYLVRLITPPNGIVLDPFTGSGTTLEASLLEGFSFVGIEKQAEYIPDIKARIERGHEALKKEIEQAQAQQSLFGGDDLCNH